LSEGAPSTRDRAVFALTVATACIAYTVLRSVRAPAFLTDLDHLLFASRELLGGRNPYVSIGPGRAFEWPFPLYYPAPTLLLVAPLGTMPVIIARALFAGVSAGLLGYVITRGGWARTPLFLSAAFVTAIGRNQWSPLLVTACLVPALGFLTAAKPNIGLATLGAQKSMRDVFIAIAGAAGLSLLSLVLRPTWPLEWLAVVRAKSDALVPAAQWIVGGPLLLLAATRWRRAEGRLVAILAITPQSPFVYDTLPLFAVARTTREALILALATDVAMFAQLVSGATAARDDASNHLMAALVTLFAYAPCIVLLMRRPNVASSLGDLDTAPPGTAMDRLLWLACGTLFAVFVFGILTLNA